MKKSKILVLSFAVLLIAAGVALAATQVVEDPCGTTAIYNKPVPNSEFKIGDEVNFSGKIRVTGCGDGLFFNRVTFYIAEDKEIPVATTPPNVYNNCFGANSLAYGDCSGIARGDQVQVLDLAKGYKVRKLGTIYPPDVSLYDGDGGYNWTAFNKKFNIPPDLGFDGNVRFYIEYSGAHWNGHWHWLIAYQKGVIIPSPVAIIGCDNSNCGSGSSCIPLAKTYEPIAKPGSCFFVLKNESLVSDIKEVNWYVKPAGSLDTSYKKKVACPSLCNYVLQNDMTSGNAYTVKLEVKDSYGQSDEVMTDVYVAREVRADFECSIDNDVWRDCEEFIGKIAKGGKVYLRDISSPSEGAAIVWWKWEVNNSTVAGEEKAHFNAENANQIKLTVRDSAGRSDYRMILLNAKPIPKWEEVAPN